MGWWLELMMLLHLVFQSGRFVGQTLTVFGVVAVLFCCCAVQDE